MRKSGCQFSSCHISVPGSLLENILIRGVDLFFVSEICDFLTFGFWNKASFSNYFFLGGGGVTILHTFILGCV